MSQPSFATADLCDAHTAIVSVCDPIFRDFGGLSAFMGPMETIRTFEDNVLLRATLETPGEGRVLVVDAGGSTRRGLVGEIVAGLAPRNGWTGILLYGAVRDSALVSSIPVGLKALATNPLRSDKHGIGQRGEVVSFAGVTFRPGEWLYADPDGVVVAPRPIHEGRGG